MKIGIVAFCLLCCCFEALHGVGQCPSISSCTTSCTENITNHSQIKDEFPRENFTLICPLPSDVKGFYMKLYKGQSNQEVCSLYVDNGKNNSERINEFCEPIHSDEMVSFSLRNLKSKDSDTYICCLEVLTPVYRCCKSNEKHLYVQDSEKSCWLSELTSWILIGLVVFLFVACIFSLIGCFKNAWPEVLELGQKEKEYCEISKKAIPLLLAAKEWINNSGSSQALKSFGKHPAESEQGFANVPTLMKTTLNICPWQQ